MNILNIPKDVLLIIDTIEASGYEAYIVGGSIRDALLGREPYDWDVTTDAPAEIVTGLFPKTGQVGVRFGIVQVRTEARVIDVAAYRIDGSYSDQRRPDQVVFTPNLLEDLKRRDFTINAMAYNPHRGLIDPYGGKADIGMRKIKTVGEAEKRFSEDALRIMRAVRFEAQLGFDLDANTAKAVKAMAPMLVKISRERIRDEFDRILMSEHASRGIKTAAETDILSYVLGDCYTTRNSHEAKAFEELLVYLDQTRHKRDIRLALIFLCFDKTKAAAAIDGLNYDNTTRDKLRKALYIASDLHNVQDKTALKQFIFDNGHGLYHFVEAIAEEEHRIYHRPGMKSMDRLAILEKIKEAREPIFVEDLAIDGDDLIEAGLSPGREIGAALKSLIALVHKQPELNEKSILLKKVNLLKE